MKIVPLTTIEEPEVDAGGLGALATERGNLPLDRIDAAVRLTGLMAHTVLTQGFRNPYDVALEATYIFPLPDRAAVTGLRLTADNRVVEADLKERADARAEYDAAIAAGQRAAITEEERPDVFTLRVGNILPGERVSIALTLVGPLSYEDGEATYRLPLVVAPRYIPGRPLPGDAVGAGWADDTDAVPDASRITPPVLLKGFPNPIRLSIGVDIDPAGLPLGAVRSSLHTVEREGNRVEIQPGERVDRDFILRLGYGQPEEPSPSLTVTPDPEGNQGTFRLTLLPPTAAGPVRPRDVVLLLDRSGSMGGWKMVAARRAASRIVDTLSGADRFAALSFDNVVEHPPSLAEGLVEATDRNRYRAVEHLSRVEARGGTELLAPLTTALGLLTDPERDRVIVLVTDGQVGNEDHILNQVTAGLRGVRVHTVGIDEAVNAGFLGRLATVGGGRCELVESEDRLDEAMERIHRRIGAPVVTTLSLAGAGIIAGTVTPARLPDLFPGAPLVVSGRFDGELGPLTVNGRTPTAQPWSIAPTAERVDDAALTLSWARSHLRDLEDAYAAGHNDDAAEQRIVATSLRFGVLCRFTAWLAVDTRVVTEGGEPHRVVQPVEQPRGWDMEFERAAPATLAGQRFAAAAPAPAMMPMAAAMPPPAGRSARMTAPMFARSAAKRESADRAEIAPADQVGRQAADEARRLRDASTATEVEQRNLLADLGTRLAALIRHIESAGVDPGLLARLRELATALADDAPLALPTAEFTALWSRALAVLEEFADSGADQRSGGGKPGRARKPFWKA